MASVLGSPRRFLDLPFSGVVDLAYSWADSFSTPHPPHILERSTLPSSTDVGYGHVTCIGQRNVSGSDMIRSFPFCASAITTRKHSSREIAGWMRVRGIWSRPKPNGSLDSSLWEHRQGRERSPIQHMEARVNDLSVTTEFRTDLLLHYWRVTVTYSYCDNS